MRKELYIAIVNQLKKIQIDESGKYITAAAVDESKSVIKEFDLWNNQVSYPDEAGIYSRPAIFIQFHPITWESRSKGIRAADVTITLHIITDFRAPSSKNKGYESQALQFFDLLNAVNAALYNLKGDFFRNLVSTGSATDDNHYELLDSQETFTVQVTDKSAVKTVVTTPAAPVVDVGFS